MSKGLKAAIAIMAVFLVFSVTLCSIFIKERYAPHPATSTGSGDYFWADDTPGGLLWDGILNSSSSSSEENSSEESSKEESSSSREESSSSPNSSSAPPPSSSAPESSSSAPPPSSSAPESSSSAPPPSSSAPESSSSAPEVDNYQYIMGTSQKTASELAAYVLRYNANPKLTCSIYELAQYYIEEGAAEGVRGDIAFCQAIKETGWFRYGGDVAWDQNNFCGLGAVGGGAGGASFDSARIGVRAHIQHLKGYATTAPLNQACVDPRYAGLSSAGRLGCAQKWTGLNGTWAVPGVGYGERIIEIYLNI